MKVSIDGMHCDACVRRVRKALEAVPGAVVNDVAIGLADIEGDKALLIEAIRKAGYEPRE